jgi:integrase
MLPTPQGDTMRPEKPYPKFPLFPHQNGQWAKKIGGKLRYFGPWADWEAALEKYHAEKDGPHDRLKDCKTKYLAAMERLQQAGEITHRHYKSVEWTLDRFAKIIGPTRILAKLGSEDYGLWRADLSKTNGPVSLGNHIRCVRAFLNWCKREKIISELPPGDSLKKPSRSVLRRARATQPAKFFLSEEIRKLLTHSSPQMKAMILLGLNAGLANNDIALLQTHHIEGQWLVYPRPKTGIERRVPLWPETCKALTAVIRPGDEVAFRTKRGNPWTSKGVMGVDSPISPKFTKLCRDIDIYKPRRGFAALRHTCQTIGEESGDHAAIESILGHLPNANDMSGIYRERMTDERLQRVVDYIRAWYKGTLDTKHTPRVIEMEVYDFGDNVPQTG